MKVLAVMKHDLLKNYRRLKESEVCEFLKAVRKFKFWIGLIYNGRLLLRLKHNMVWYKAVVYMTRQRATAV